MVAWCKAPRRNAPQCAPMRHEWRVRQGFPFHRWGSGGPPPGIFYKYKLWKGHFGAILKTPEKKKAKKGFSQKLGKKGFCLQKKGSKRFKRFPREAWLTPTATQENRAYHPGGHYWDYYPGALFSRQVIAIHLNIGLMGRPFLWSSKSFTLPQPANHLFIKINLLHVICTKNSHVYCGLCW